MGYRFEAVSRMMGRWETLRFQRDAEREGGASGKCVVGLFTANGMVLANDGAANLVFVEKEGNDVARCRWSVVFHDRACVSIRNVRFGGWLVLRKQIKTGIFVLGMLNADFGGDGQPVV